MLMKNQDTRCAAVGRFRAALCLAALFLLLCAGLRLLSRDRTLLLGKAGAAEREKKVTDAIPAKERALFPSRLWNRLLCRRFFPQDDILIREDGQHLKGSAPQKTEFAEKNLAALARYCRERGKAFLYVILPGKPERDAEFLELGLSCGRNLTADRMKENLSRMGIPCLDARTLFAGKDFYRYFYRTDHHWTADAGLRAAAEMLAFLERETGTAYDRTLLDPARFVRRELPDGWVGEMGRKTLGALSGEERLVELTPGYPVRLRYTNAKLGARREGGFEILLNGKENGYYRYLYNNARMEFENPDRTEGDLLVLKDSFSNAMLPFLALAVRHITAWDMREDRNLYAYLDAHPEIETVVVAYNISFMPTSRMNDFQ